MNRYKSRLVLTGVLIFTAIMLICGVLIVSGVYNYTFDNNLSSVYMIAEDTNIFINQSVGTTQLNDRTHVLFTSAADYYARKISALYSVDVILYDTQFNVVGTNVVDAENIEYKAYASTVYESGKTSYVLTDVSGEESVVMFSLLRSGENVYGVCAIIKSMAAAHTLITRITRIFSYVGIFAVLMCIVLFNATYTKMLEPIKKLKDYNESVINSEEITPPDINYKSDDEVKALITSSENMAMKINEKMMQLQLQNDKFETVVSALEDGIVMVDEYRNEILANNGAVSYFHGEKFINVIPNISANLDDAFLKGKTTKGEYVYNDKNYLYTVTPVLSHEGEDQAMIVISDITAIKSLEAEQNKFISSVSHELKTPLTTIIGYIDLLHRRGIEDEALTNKALDVTKSEAKRLLRLVNDLLNINSYQRLDFDFIFTDVDMNQLLSDATTEMNVKASENNITIVYNATDLPKVSGDYDRLKQVILNVLDNALKYSHEQDIIRITATAYEEILEITVRDYGEGIPENVRSKVFDAFYRVGDDRSRLSGGFGLGLSIVKHIIQKHGGEVDIESVLGQGTLVIIKLPVKKDEIITQEEEIYDEDYENEEE